jgi:hypothetical protein
MILKIGKKGTLLWVKIFQLGLVINARLKEDYILPESPASSVRITDRTNFYPKPI